MDQNSQMKFENISFGYFAPLHYNKTINTPFDTFWVWPGNGVAQRLSTQS